MATQNSISRRKFLELLGVTTVGAIAANVTIPSSITSASSGDRADFAKSLAIVVESPLYRQAIDELEAKGFLFDLKKSTFQRAPKEPGLVGIVLAQTKTPSRKTGADIALTVSLREEALHAVNYVVGQSNEDSLEIARVNLTFGKSRTASSESFARGQATLQRGAPVLPIGEVIETISGQVSNKPAPESVCTPSSYTECTDWYYSSCCQASWCCCPAGIFCSTTLVCICNREYRNCRKCRRNSNCSISCGSWFSQWRNVSFTCRGVGCQ
jgi:hypothetical protein